MSVKVSGKVWDTTLRPNLKYVLLAYADGAEHDGTNIWPGRERLLEMTGYSPSQLEAITSVLLDLGVLVQVERGRKGRRASFRIDLSHPLFIVSDDRTLSGDSVRSDPDCVRSDAHSVRPTGHLPSSSSVLTSQESEDRTQTEPLPDGLHAPLMFLDVCHRHINGTRCGQPVDHASHLSEIEVGA